MHRSILIVKHGPHSHKITELVDNTHLFDNQIMDAFLEQFTYTENTAKQGTQEPDRKELMRQARRKVYKDHEILRSLVLFLL